MTRTQEVLRATMKDGVTPVEYLLGVMRDETKDEAVQRRRRPTSIRKLANIEHSGSMTMSWEDALQALANRQVSNGVDATGFMQSAKRADA